ncbi:nitrate/nitrite response regulator protein NarL [Salmonella enterica subsp. enterica]|uniref:Nitrate/nitrite response regulator protein NarL n=1 Tax=Salmonella enterica I TaxID=59201 RepID=A0A379WT66_SALET|nr:nitrate/nitrite response regulator protein NarL [Salmonella enterica subsp. enterica]
MIARRLDITESTVKVHVKHMLKKMKLKSRVEAAVWVHQERIFYYCSWNGCQCGLSSGIVDKRFSQRSVISLEETR